MPRALDRRRQSAMRRRLRGRERAQGRWGSRCRLVSGPCALEAEREAHSDRRASRLGPPRRRKGAAGKRGNEIWTWTAIDPDSKLIVASLVGDGDTEAAKFFIGEVATRLASPVILRAEGDTAFLEASRDESGAGIDDGIFARLYGAPEDAGTEADALSQAPWDPKDRIRVRRPAWLTKALARQVEDHAHGLALSAMHHNFVRIDKVSGLTPAMAAGIVDTPWNLRSIEAVLAMWEKLKTGPWYERLVVLRGASAAANPSGSTPPSAAERDLPAEQQPPSEEQ